MACYGNLHVFTRVPDCDRFTPLWCGRRWYVARNRFATVRIGFLNSPSTLLLEQEIVEMTRYIGEMPFLQGDVSDPAILRAYCERRDPPLQVFHMRVPCSSFHVGWVLSRFVTQRGVPLFMDSVCTPFLMSYILKIRAGCSVPFPVGSAHTFVLVVRRMFLHLYMISYRGNLFALCPGKMALMASINVRKLNTRVARCRTIFQRRSS